MQSWRRTVWGPLMKDSRIISHRYGSACGESIFMGVETSCDDTAVAICTADGAVLSHIVDTQHQLHAIHGGIVPHLASKSHKNKLPSIVRSALLEAKLQLENVDIFAVTRGPGMEGCLNVGFGLINSLSMLLNKKCYHINHLVSNCISMA